MIKETLLDLVKRRVSNPFKAILETVRKVMELKFRQLIPEMGIKVRSEDQFVRDQMEKSFSTTYGTMKLSRRVWSHSRYLQRLMKTTISNGIKASEHFDDIVEKLKQDIDRAYRRTNAIDAKLNPDWMTRIHAVSTRLLTDPSLKAKWKLEMKRAEKLVNAMSNETSRTKALKVLERLKNGVHSSIQSLVDTALEEHLVNRQERMLQRIVRTEYANARIRAAADSMKDKKGRLDRDVIGFRWELNTLHPEPDICDELSNIEVGLGKGIFDRKEYPRACGHPNCMCKLIPVILPNKEKGTISLNSIRSKLPVGFLSTDKESV